MILRSSVIQYLFYTFLIYYNFHITNGQSSRTSTIATTIISESTTIIATAETPEPTTTIVTRATPESKTKFITMASSNTKTGQSTVMTSKHTNHTTSTARTSVMVVTDGNIIVLNSTEVSNGSKFKLPVMLKFIFGGLAILALITSIIIYILFKKGHINIFNEPRTRIKNVERARMIDSSSVIGRGSPSRR